MTSNITYFILNTQPCRSREFVRILQNFKNLREFLKVFKVFLRFLRSKNGLKLLRSFFGYNLIRQNWCENYLNFIKIIYQFQIFRFSQDFSWIKISNQIVIVEVIRVTEVIRELAKQFQSSTTSCLTET